MLVTIEHAGGQTVGQAKLAVRHLLAERDRVLREPLAMRLPPIAPEKLAGVIKELVATLEQSSTLIAESAWSASPMA